MMFYPLFIRGFMEFIGIGFPPQLTSWKYFFFFGILFAYIGVTSLWIVYTFHTGEVKRDDSKFGMICFVALVVISWIQTRLFQLIYNLTDQMITHSTSRHAVDVDNAAVIESALTGGMVNFVMTYLTIWMMTYVIFDYYKLKKWIYLNITAPLMVCQLLLQIKIVHPYVCTQGPSWHGLLVAKCNMDNYTGYVFCHHFTDYCLGHAPTYSWLFSHLTINLSKWYEFSSINFSTPKQYILQITVELFLVAFIFMVLFATVALTHPFLQRVDGTFSFPEVKAAVKSQLGGYNVF